MLQKVQAHFVCDTCSKAFAVRIDSAVRPRAGWSVFEIAEDAIRAGLDYEDENPIPGGFGAVDNGNHYCVQCAVAVEAEA